MTENLVTTSATAMELKNQRPWYKQKFFWLLCLPPAISLAVGAVMLTIALRQPMALVVDDYTNEGKAINRILIRDENAFKAGLVAKLNLSDSMSVQLSARDKNFAMADKITITILHPSLSAQDQTITMEHMGEGQYIAKQTFKEMPIRNVIIESSDQRWRLVSVLHPKPQDLLTITAVQ